MLVILDTDRQLIENCISGKREAQYQLYHKYSRSMYNICKRMVNDDMEAEDVLQNSFVDIFTKLNTFNHDSTPGAWIKRVVVNNCINHIRKRKMVFKEFDQNMDVVDHWDDDQDVQLNVKAVHEAISMLPDGYRVVFSLYTMEGYDHGEIAEILNISESTSKSQYSRSKVKLYDIIKSNGGISKYVE